MYEQFGFSSRVIFLTCRFFKFESQSDKKYYEYVKMVLAECEEYFPRHWGEKGTFLKILISRTSRFVREHV